MGKNGDPGSLTEAIAKLENGSHSKAQEIKESLEKEYRELKQKMEKLGPQFEEIKNKIEDQAKQAKHDVEEKVKENPWLALGIVGLIAFFIGWLLGHQRRDR